MGGVALGLVGRGVSQGGSGGLLPPHLLLTPRRRQPGDPRWRQGGVSLLPKPRMKDSSDGAEAVE